MAIIVLDPGHYGGYNQGICPGYYEGNAMLKLAKSLGPILSSMGADVRYTRTTNEANPSLAERGGMVPNADLFLSLHSDASDYTTARGVTAFYSVQRPNTETFAADLGTAAANAMGNQFRGAVTWPSTTNPSLDYLGVLRAAVAANVKNAFLIEHGFHTNMEDCLFLSSDANLQKLAAAEVSVIAQYLGLSQACNVYYTVQYGDSLFSIAQKFDIDWQSIASANSIGSPYVITQGQRLIIPLPSTTPSSCQMTYNVRSGDTLYSISQAFGVSWQTIASLNNISSPYVITPGQQLLIPMSAGTETSCQFVYTVKSGDTLYTIAQRYGLSWSSVASSNNLTSPYVIVPGQCLIIPLPRA